MRFSVADERHAAVDVLEVVVVQRYTDGAVGRGIGGVVSRTNEDGLPMVMKVGIRDGNERGPVLDVE